MLLTTIISISPFILFMYIHPTSPFGISSVVWNMTKDVMKEFNTQDLIIYFLYDYPDNDVISSTFKDPSHDIQASIIGLGNLMDIPNHYYRSEVPSVKLVLLENSSSSVELEAISARENWNLVNVWLVGLPPKQEDDNRTAFQIINGLFKNIKLTYTAQVYVFFLDEGKAFLYETYKITETDTEVEVLSYGFWSNDSKLDADASHLWHRRANLKGKHIRISALLNIPYETMVVNGCQDSSCFKGMFADVFHELQKMMNFTYTMIMPPDGQWGSQLEDDSWTGIIGQLDKKEVDIGAADFRITSSRIRVVNFLPPLDDPHMRLFIANPADAFNWYAYINPFPTATWIVVIIVLILLPPIVSFLLLKGIREPNWRDYTIFQSYGFVSGTIAMRDWSPVPEKPHGRIIFFSVVLFGTMVYYHWEAMIISYLSMRTIRLPFNSLEELLSNTDFKIAVLQGTAYVDSFKYSTTPIYQRAWNERMEPYADTFPSTKDGLSELIHQDKSYAMFDNYNTRVYYDDYIQCRTVDIPKKYFQIQYAMPVAKELPYFEALKYHTSSLKETGSLMQIKDRYRNDPQVCPDYSGKPLGFNQTFTAFLVLIGGLAVGGLLLGFEMVVRPQMLGMDTPRTLDPFALSFESNKIESSGSNRILHEIKENMEEITKLERKNATLRKRLNVTTNVAR